LANNFFLNPLWAFLKRHPQVKLFTGIESFRRFNSENKTSDSKRIGDSNDYYESYNGSVLLDSTGMLQYYHKTMLVPGVETLPGFLKFLSAWFEKFGGTGGGYAKQKERTVINTGEWKLAPAICYESIYGQFMSRYVNNGANLITIITNDGWWKNTPGHKQHMNYARLRAIETRRWVARSANTGISCFIKPDGSILQSEPWGAETAIKASGITISNGKTFYVRYGDLVYQVAALATGMIILAIVYLRIRKKW
jgi:apolipoprotein N-acyltransferase